MNDRTVEEAALVEGRPVDPVYDAFGNHIFITMSVIANRMGQSASINFRQNFGIGTMDWRVVHVLGFESPLSAQQLSERTDLDRAAISRSLRVLADLGWIEVTRTGRSTPRKLVAITPLGHRMREEVVGRSLARQERIFSQVPTEQMEEFQKVLKFLMEKTAERKDYY